MAFNFEIFDPLDRDIICDGVNKSIKRDELRDKIKDIDRIEKPGDLIVPLSTF